MSKRASPAVLGAFVVAGIGIVLIAIVVLGGARLFRHTAPVIVYFDGSVTGLHPGASVKFRGIEIGSVREIRINMSKALRDAENIRIPVVLEIDQDRLTSEGVAVVDLHDRGGVRALVDRGVRAQLETESFVTGIRYVALDIKPGTPVRLVNDRTIPYPEIPSIPNARDQIGDKVNAVLDNLAEADVAGLTRSLTETADDAHKLLGSPGLKRSVDRIDEVTANLSQAIATLAPAVRGIGPDGAISRQLDATLDALKSAARSMRRLTDHLDRDPGSILRGGRQ